MNVVGFFKQIDKKIDGFLILFLAAALAPLIFISFYNQPSADDYCFASLLKEQGGFFEVQKFWYVHWGGRYFATAMGCFSPIVFHTYIGYKFQSILLIMLFVIGVYWVIGLVYSNVSRSTRWSITLLLSFLYILYFPDIAQGLFWMSGAIVYQLPIIFTVYLIGCIIKFLNFNKKIFVFYAMLLCFAIIGSNEEAMLFNDIFIVVVLIGNYFHTKKVNYYLLALLCAAILFSTIVIAAPGNNIRSSYYPGHGRFLFSVIHAFKEGLIMLFKWTFKNLFVFLLILCWLVIKTDPGKSIKPIVNPFIILFFCVFIPIIGTFIGYWSTGDSPESRTVNIPYFYFILSSVYFIYSLVCYIKQHLNINSVEIPAGLYSFLVITVFYLVISNSNNVNTVYRDIFSGRATYYNKQINQRFEVIKNCKGHLCYLAPIANVPKSFSFTDITADSTNWINGLFSPYYGKTCVLVK